MEGSWYVVRRPVSFVICRNCGYMPRQFGWSREDAIEVAMDNGWKGGLCPMCQELLKMEEARHESDRLAQQG
jgi:hypothetical protein